MRATRYQPTTMGTQNTSSPLPNDLEKLFSRAQASLAADNSEFADALQKARETAAALFASIQAMPSDADDDVLRDLCLQLSQEVKDACAQLDDALKTVVNSPAAAGVQMRFLKTMLASTLKGRISEVCGPKAEAQAR